MKYIDADRLRAEINKRKKSLRAGICGDAFTRKQKNEMLVASEELDRLNSIIDSLQQEQPETSNNLVDVDAVREDFMTKVYRILDADPTNDRANAIINAFDSLPTVSQRPKVDLVAELKHHLDTTPKEQLEKEWKELEPWGNIGPTVQEFLYGKQSKVDLEKETIIDYVHNHYHYDKDFDGYGHSNLRPVFTREDLVELARHFYELGLNTRKDK